MPFEAFLQDPMDAAARVPKDRPVAVVCGRGRTSAYVTEVLRGVGLRAFSLAGGMLAWRGDVTLEP
ncbi:MAG: rhodanese-like domain-containing protein [Bacillota bacterium]